MFCRNCGKELPDNAVACMECGCDPRKENKYCPHCGVEVQSNQIVCVKCGSALNGGAIATMGASGRQAKSKLAYLLLAIFLGEFGVHNFYAGYTNNGVIQLLVSLVGGPCTCGISSIAVWIWAIVEGVTKEVDASGTPFAT